jgi:RNA polymerase subunit RPABC4/transcription elongation factor Spt4
LAILNLVFIVVVFRRRHREKGEIDSTTSGLESEEKSVGKDDEESNICAECGEEVPDDSELCPHCGVAIEKREKKIEIKSEKKEPKKETKAEKKEEHKVEDISSTNCVVCGEEIPDDSELCPHCGVTLEVKGKKKEETFVEAPEDKNVCPECWEDVGSEDAICIHCGYTPLTDGVQVSDEVSIVDKEDEFEETRGEGASEIDMVFDEIEDISMEDAVQEAAEKVLEQGIESPETEKIIGELAARMVEPEKLSDEEADSIEDTDHTIDEKSEYEISEEISKEPEEEEIESHEAEYPLAIIEEEKKGVKCQQCNAPLVSGESVCGSCGVELNKWVGELDRLGAELDEMEIEDEEEESGKVVGMLEEAMESAKDIEVKLFDIYEIEYRCPVCEEIIEEETPFCPNCGIRFDDEEASLAKWTDDEVSLGLKGRYVETDEDYDFEIVFNPNGDEKHKYLTISSPTTETPESKQNQEQ